MLATLERIELLEYAEDLAKMVLTSDIAEQYQISLYKMQNNKETQRKINRFASLKELYEEVQRFGKYHPDYKRVMLQIREAKREMDLDPLVADFKLAENDLQTLLDEISKSIGGAVSEHIKVPSGNPFFETGHSCGTGGSCGCS
ncbi:YlbF family regulator [Bacillus sp. ISL-18]|uniref:YlbF family regulator n=1 Tax=Bacillaceae TaxID=186817 RepID=UPI001BEAF604|nr:MULTISPECIES: YlbF family regulator [Bacillaceae]MBT2654244.1 YlbF family regulator [Bacillus sp. ISL-18]ULT58469.1 YlbF family regulator [Neobacillus drentensis]